MIDSQVNNNKGNQENGEEERRWKRTTRVFARDIDRIVM